MKNLKLKQMLVKSILAKALDLKTLSSLSRVPRKTIQGWLDGEVGWDVGEVWRVAEVLGVSLEELLYGQKVPISFLAPNSEVEIARWLRKLRSRVRLNLGEVSQLTGFSIEEIELWENFGTIAVSELVRLTDCYQVGREVVGAKLITLIKKQRD